MVIGFSLNVNFDDILSILVKYLSRQSGPFVRKLFNVLVFLIVSAKSKEVPIELSEDCYCSISMLI